MMVLVLPFVIPNIQKHRINDIGLTLDWSAKGLVVVDVGALGINH